VPPPLPAAPPLPVLLLLLSQPSRPNANAATMLIQNFLLFIILSFRPV
jgi:hypothetical protein